MSETIVLRARTPAFVAFGTITGLPLLLAGVAALSRGGEAWKLVAIGAVAFVFVLAWLRSFSLTLADDAISYRTLFGGTKALALTDIRSAAVKMGSFNAADRFKPTVRLELCSLTEYDPAIVINMRVFPADGLDRILERLEQRGLLEKP